MDRILGQMDKCIECQYQIVVTKPNGEVVTDCRYANSHWGCVHDYDGDNMVLDDSEQIKQTILKDWFKGE